MKTAHILLGIALLTRTASAQGTDPTSPSPTLISPTAATLTRLSDEDLHARLLADNPAYRTARNRKIAGVLTASIGGAAGLVTMVVGAVFWGVGGVLAGEHGEHLGWADQNPRLLCIGAGVTALSLGVGLPLALLGHRQMERIRSQSRHAWLPTLNVSTGPNGGYLEAGWKF